VIDYSSNTRAKVPPEAKGTTMTVLHPRDTWIEFGDVAGDTGRPVRAPRRIPAAGAPPARPVTRRAATRRPGGTPVQHRRSGVMMSRASHRRRPITPATTVLLALVAAAFTVWLGLIAQSGGVVGTPTEKIPSRLAVVQVHSGESLQQVAQRVAPDAPVAQVVQRIRELNDLGSASLDPGQTLIAPMA
jgi:hypothetical protein